MPPATDPPALLKNGVPDWTLIGFEVSCARCGYNLRGLTSPRCPECGLDFDWRDALNRGAFESDFLFEHRWRKRPVRSFLVTVWRSFRPIRFWRLVSIHERIALAPLAFLVFASFGLAFGVVQLVARGVAWGLQLAGGNFGAYLWGRWPGLGSALWALMALVESRRRPFSFAARLAIEMAVMIVAMLTLILLLRQTLAGCRVQFAQVFRVVAYAAIPVSLLETLLRLAAVCIPRTYQYAISTEDYLFASASMFAVAVALATAIPAIYLAAGIRDYLRLPHAWAIALSAALVGVLCRGLVHFKL